MNKKYLIILTGGTFGSEKGKPTTKESLVLHLKKMIKSLNINDFEYDIEVPYIILSENINYNYILKLNNFIEKKINKYKGILLIHGTDTMAYTSSFLSFNENISKNIPIVITGSNKSAFEEDTDAYINLKHSIISLKFFDKENINGVYIVFNGISEKEKTFIHLGSKLKKITWHGNCYETYNMEKTNYIGFIYKDEIYLNYDNLFNKIKFFNYKLTEIDEFKFNEQIFYFKITPTIQKKEILKINKNTKIVILELYGSGTAPEWLAEDIEKLVKFGILVLGISGSKGGLDLSKYETSQKLEKAGLISMKNLFLENLLSKSVIGLLNFQNLENIKKYLLTDIANEYLY